MIARSAAAPGAPATSPPLLHLLLQLGACCGNSAVVTAGAELAQACAETIQMSQAVVGATQALREQLPGLLTALDGVHADLEFAGNSMPIGGSRSRTVLREWLAARLTHTHARTYTHTHTDTQRHIHTPYPSQSAPRVLVLMSCGADKFSVVTPTVRTSTVHSTHTRFPSVEAQPCSASLPEFHAALYRVVTLRFRVSRR